MPLVVDTLQLGPIGTNCHVVRAGRTASEAAVIDPGWDAAKLRLQLAGSGARCAAILVTHSHWDHIAAVADLAEGTGAPVYAPAGEDFVLRDPRAFYPDVPVRPVEPDTLLRGGESVGAAGIEFEVLLVPGHSPGHLAFHADGSLFSGDVLFAGGVGRVDLPGGDWDTLLASIRMLAERFPPDTVVYPGHGPATTLGEELVRNPFLAELRAASQ